MEVTIPLPCGNCVNVSRMDIVGAVKESHTATDDYGEPTYEYGTSYFITKCPVCREVNIYRDSWHDMQEYQEPYDLLYPSQKEFPVGIPGNILSTLKSAEKIKGIDVNAYAILLRRMLELVCIDRSAKGDTLAKMLKDLSDRGEIPGKLVTIAKGIKDLGNVGAHPLAGELCPEEIPILRALSLALLEYIYSAPYLADMAEKQLLAVKSRSKKD